MASAFAMGPAPFPIAMLSVEQYHRMVASGAFTEDDRLELIEGWLVAKMAKGPAHEYATGQCEQALRDRLPAGWHVRNQAPITLDRSEPEPDLCVARGDRGAYRDRHPRAADVALVVEVADTTLATDRRKGKTYGTAGVPSYWIVNLVDATVEIYARPSADEPSGYASREVLGADDAVRLVVDGEDRGTFAVRELL